MLDQAASSGIDAARAREDARLDAEPNHKANLEALAKRYEKETLRAAKVEPKTSSKEARRRANHATLSNLGRADFEREGLILPLLRFALGTLRPGEGGEQRAARFASEIDALRRYHSTPVRVEVGPGERLRRTLMLGATISSSRTNFEPDMIDELDEVLARAMGRVEARDPGVGDLLARWHVAIVDPSDYGAAYGSAVSVAARMRKGELIAPPFTKLRAPFVSAPLLVAESIGLECSEANAKLLAERQREAREHLRELLLDVDLSDEPRRLIL